MARESCNPRHRGVELEREQCIGDDVRDEAEGVHGVTRRPESPADASHALYHPISARSLFVRVTRSHSSRRLALSPSLDHA